MLPLVEIFCRPACALCDEAKAVVHSVRGRLTFALQEVDISKDASLLARYGYDVPMIRIQGVDCFRHRVSAEALVEAISASGGTPVAQDDSRAGER